MKYFLSKKSYFLCCRRKSFWLMRQIWRVHSMWRPKRYLSGHGCNSPNIIPWARRSRSYKGVLLCYELLFSSFFSKPSCEAKKMAYFCTRLWDFVSYYPRPVHVCGETMVGSAPAKLTNMECPGILRNRGQKNFSFLFLLSAEPRNWRSNWLITITRPYTNTTEWGEEFRF